MRTAPEPMSRIELLMECSIIAEGGGRATVHTVLPDPRDAIGWLGPAIDMVSGRAYNTLQSPDRTCVTLSLRLDAGAPVESAGVLRLDCAVIHTDGSFALAQTVIRDSRERVVATASSRFLTIPMPEFDGPDAVTPWRTEGVRYRDVIGPNAIEQTDAERTAHYLPRDEFTNPSGVLHGGVQFAMLADSLHEQARHALDAQPRLLDLTVEFLTPVPNDPGGPHNVITSTDRGGRRIALVSGRLGAADGASGTRAHATFHLA